MRYFVENELIDENRIGIPAMNFGQEWRYNGLKKVVYEIHLSDNELRERLGPWFYNFRNEIIEDAKMSERCDFPILDRYEEAGFPDLDELIASDRQSLSGLILFSDLDVLNVLCEHNVMGKPFFLINSLEKISSHEHFILTGTAFEIK